MVSVSPYCRIKIILTIFLIAIAALAYTQTHTVVSKKNYSPFNPAPKNLMREFTTDRPDATESAYTVDAGHFQLETDLFKTEYFKATGITTNNNFYNVANIKMGITNSLDLQLVASSLVVSTINNGTSKTKTFGFGSVTLRAKKNLWGNDNGQSALAILPFINIPAKNDSRFSGGILIPFSLSLPHGWDIGAQAGIDIANGATGNSYYLNFLSSATVSYSLFNNFDFFVEGVLSRDSESEIYEYFLDSGFVFALAPTVHIDTGIYYGLKSVSSTTFFLGLSFRL